MRGESLLDHKVKEIEKAFDTNYKKQVEGLTCVHCGSKHLSRLGFAVRPNPYRVIRRYRCTSCGRTFTFDPTKAAIKK